MFVPAPAEGRKHMRIVGATCGRLMDAKGGGHRPPLRAATGFEAQKKHRLNACAF